jgi:uncharacterized protein YbaR (Trm112 family)
LNADELLELLACPKCHDKLAAIDAPVEEAGASPRPAEEAGASRRPLAGFVCQPCQLFYAVEDGLPNMLISEAQAWPLAPASA